jgi:quercetin dioxygenase-like cupin family protein
MNLIDLFTDDKPLQTKRIFASGEGVTAIQLMADAILQEHITKVPAFLVCVTGEVIFENELGIKEKLLPGDYINITPEVKHWINAHRDSLLLLIK